MFIRKRLYQTKFKQVFLSRRNSVLLLSESMSAEALLQGAEEAGNVLDADRFEGNAIEFLKEQK